MNLHMNSGRNMSPGPSSLHVAARIHGARGSWSQGARSGGWRLSESRRAVAQVSSLLYRDVQSTGRTAGEDWDRETANSRMKVCPTGGGVRAAESAGDRGRCPGAHRHGSKSGDRVDFEEDLDVRDALVGALPATTAVDEALEGFIRSLSNIPEGMIRSQRVFHTTTDEPPVAIQLVGLGLPS